MSGKIEVEPPRGLAMDVCLTPLYFCPKTMTQPMHEGFGMTSLLPIAQTQVLTHSPELQDTARGGIR